MTKAVLWKFPHMEQMQTGLSGPEQGQGLVIMDGVIGWQAPKGPGNNEESPTSVQSQEKVSCLVASLWGADGK